MSAATLKIFNRLLRVIETFGPGALSALFSLCRRAKDSGDPEFYFRRLVKAESAHRATQKVVKETLKKVR